MQEHCFLCVSQGNFHRFNTQCTRYFVTLLYGMTVVYTTICKAQSTNKKLHECDTVSDFCCCCC